jgi:NDP-sugar pyrophosphorylase family protein|tara:strand:- start:2203 stop:2904 length:702 start_codon:yes stop_codon:yes gene_type:complete
MSELSQVTAVILAGGFGTRLSKIVSDRPKVMAGINSKPFITFLLDQLVEAGIENVVISTGFMAHVIEGAIGFSYEGMQVDYSREKTPLGTGGALKLAGRVVDTEFCQVMNGDSCTEFDPISLFMTHKQKNANITILVKAVADTSRYGAIKMSDQKEIVGFMEKGSSTGTGLINTGVYAMKASTFKEIPDRIPSSLEYDFFPSMIDKGIYGYETEGKFIDIGTPESYAQAEKFF